MNILYKSLCAGTLAISMAASAFVPAMAAPIHASFSEVGQAKVIQVQSRREVRRDRRELRRDRRELRRDRRDHRRARFERRNGHYYYHGHRGYSHRRPGYRQYNGYWFPPAAFVVGAVIGGAIASSSGSSSSHVAWCENHYRSYRVSDDTYQPYNGPRQRCVSP